MDKPGTTLHQRLYYATPTVVLRYTNGCTTLHQRLYYATPRGVFAMRVLPYCSQGKVGVGGVAPNNKQIILQIRARFSGPCRPSRTSLTQICSRTHPREGFFLPFRGHHRRRYYATKWGDYATPRGVVRYKNSLFRRHVAIFAPAFTRHASLIHVRERL